MPASLALFTREERGTVSSLADAVPVWNSPTCGRTRQRMINGAPRGRTPSWASRFLITAAGYKWAGNSSARGSVTVAIRTRSHGSNRGASGVQSSRHRHSARASARRSARAGTFRLLGRHAPVVHPQPVAVGELGHLDLSGQPGRCRDREGLQTALHALLGKVQTVQVLHRADRIGGIEGSVHDQNGALPEPLALLGRERGAEVVDDAVCGRL